MLTIDHTIDQIRKGILVNTNPKKGYIEPIGGLEFAVIGDIWQPNPFTDEFVQDIRNKALADETYELADVFVTLLLSRPYVGFTNYCVKCREDAFKYCPCRGYVEKQTYHEHVCPYYGFTNTSLHYTHPEINKGYYYLVCPLLKQVKCPHAKDPRIKAEEIDVFKDCLPWLIESEKDELKMCPMWHDIGELLINIGIDARSGGRVNKDLKYEILPIYLHHRSIYTTKTEHDMDGLI